MNLRFINIWLAISFISGTANAAGNPAWNCEQNSKGEWTCLNQGPAATEPEPVKPQTVKPQTAETVRRQPDPIKPEQVKPPQADNPPPIAQTPAAAPQIAAPIPAPAATQASAVASPTPAAVNDISEPTQPKRHVNVTQNQKPRVEKIEPVREPIATAPKQAGWTCQSGDEKQAWNCNLVGRDPKGQAVPVPSPEADTQWLTPTFSRSQESTFQTLRGEFKKDPWQNCENWSMRRRKGPVLMVDRENAGTDVMANSSEAFEGEVLNFAGNVDLTRADQHLLADKASYDTGADTMDAQGNVIYSETTLALASDTASLSMGTNEARLRKALFISSDLPLRGSAEAIYRDNEYLSRYNDAVFTSCAPGNQDWMIHASRLKINRESGQGSAKDGWLEFKGVPVFYTPYMSFPTDNRRLSGFLSPTWGSTQRSGFYVAAPYYWNIAPNMDATITPRYFSGRGEMLSNSFRYLTEKSVGTLGAEFMPNDQKIHKSRYSFSLKDKSTIMSGMSSAVDLNLVSDATYFNDLNTALAFNNRSTVLPSTALLGYGLPGASFGAFLYHYQAIDPTITTPGMPYDILPRLSLNLDHHFEGMPLKIGMDNQYSYFYRTPTDNTQRMMAWPYVAMPFESSAGFITPKISVQSTQYQINTLTAGQASSINRTLPVMSLDSGLTLEKSMNIGGSAYTNLIEPRIFYLYIPRKDQSNIPIYDTSAFDTNFNSLFRENSYSGFDRLQDANQITLAATTRFIDSTTGLEPLKASLGQIIYFQGRTVTTPGVPIQTSKTSNYIGEISGQLSQNWSYSTGAQWNTTQNSFARGQAVLKYRNQPNQLIDIGYRYRSASANPLVTPSVIPGTSTQANISLADASFRLPLAGEWYALGRWQYSLNFNKTTESFIGLEKENCCWRFRVIGRHYINGATYNNSIVTPNIKPETAFFVELELKGLSGIGDDIDYFLQNTLNGYRPAGYFN